MEIGAIRWRGLVVAVDCSLSNQLAGLRPLDVAGMRTDIQKVGAGQKNDDAARDWPIP
jgi:hypothetical protein